MKAARILGESGSEIASYEESKKNHWFEEEVDVVPIREKHFKNTFLLDNGV